MDDFCSAGDVEAVREGSANVDFGGLSVGVCCHDALAESDLPPKFQTIQK